MQITRKQLVIRLAMHFPGIVAKDAENSVALILDAIAQAIAHGNRVEIRGFGCFFATEIGDRLLRDPRSGELAQVPARRRPRFRTSDLLKRRVDRMIS